MARMYSVSVSHQDGAFYVAPTDSIEAGLLDGMIAAQDFARESIAWHEITDRYCKGNLVTSGTRILVLWSDLPMAAEDELTDWLHA